MSDCIFCKIVSGEVPSDNVYEDDDVLAFLDIAPVNRGHTLLIPKAHSEDLLETSPEALSAVTRVLGKVSRAVKESVGADGFNIGINNGSAAGQIVPHMHVHIIPRFVNDGYKLWGHRRYGADEASKIAESIRAKLL